MLGPSVGAAYPSCPVARDFEQPGGVAQPLLPVLEFGGVAGFVEALPFPTRKIRILERQRRQIRLDAFVQRVINGRHFLGDDPF